MAMTEVYLREIGAMTRVFASTGSVALARASTATTWARMARVGASMEDRKPLETTADVARARLEALREIKRLALECMPSDVPQTIGHIVRLCIDAGAVSDR